MYDLEERKKEIVKLPVVIWLNKESYFGFCTVFEYKYTSPTDIQIIWSPMFK